MNFQQSGLAGAKEVHWQQTANAHVENCTFIAPDMDHCAGLQARLSELDDRLNEIRRMVGTFNDRMLGERSAGEVSGKQGPQPVPSGKLGELHATLIRTMSAAELLGEQASRLAQIG